ncbi:hypothetical protein Trydic_g12328, partial [Trypoxylus dichotomus]
FGARPQYKKLVITNIAGACLEVVLRHCIPPKYTAVQSFCSTLERQEPLDLGGLDVASTYTSTSTIIHINIGDPVLAEVDAARKRQPTPRANLDPMVCKFLQNHVMLNVTPPPGGRFRVDSKVITMRQEHTT